MLSSLPIRIRLTLLYSAMFASAALLLCMTNLWMLKQSADEAEYHELQERADDVRAVLQHEKSNLTAQQLGDELAAIYDLKDDGKYLQVRDEEGNWVFRSKRMIAEDSELLFPDRLPARGLITGFHQKNHDVRILSYPIVVNQKRYSVQTGIVLDKSIALLASFRAKILFLAPIVILLAGAGGHAMSRTALSPVAALAAEARRINERNLGTRLPVPIAKDEISDLSLTLNQMLERIEQAFATVRTFTGNASHELRTPISLLRTELEVALYRPRSAEEYRTTLGHLHEEVLRMSGLVESLLALARADGGAEVIALNPIRLDALLHQAADTWRHATNQAMLDFAVEVPDADIFVLGDENTIQRLLSILLENATKYTAPGGSIKLSAVAERERILISVRDTGFGIAPEHKLRIFDRFYRTTPSGGSQEGGSGLGLSLAKWIADLHGTELVVESEPGHGSSFSFWLKIAERNPSSNQDWTASVRVVNRV